MSIEENKDYQLFKTIEGEKREENKINLVDILQKKDILVPNIPSEIINAIDIIKYHKSLIRPKPLAKNTINSIDDILEYGLGKKEFTYESPYFYLDEDVLTLSSLAIGDMSGTDRSDSKICHGDFISSFLGNNRVIHSMFGLKGEQELGIINAEKSQKYILPVYVGEAIKYSIKIRDSKKIRDDELGNKRIFTKLDFIITKLNPQTGSEEICVKDGTCNAIFFQGK